MISIMLKPKLMRAARALLEWEQSDLARAANLSIATIRKIEQGSTGMREDTAHRIMAAFDQAGLRLIPNGQRGGIGVRLKEREMDEQMRSYLDLKNKLKGWFIYNLGRGDNEELDCEIDELAFDAISPNEEREELNKLALPAALIADLEKLGDMENGLGAQQDQKMLDRAKAAGWDGDPATLPAYVHDDDEDCET